MTEVPDLSELAIQPDPETRQDDSPSMRALVLCQEPTETFELDLVNLEGVIIGMRIDGSELLYIPWSRVRLVVVPRSQPANPEDEPA